MFKRVKSLVLAGALVLGMAVPAFAADDTTLGKVTKNYSDSMKGLGVVDTDAKTRIITSDDYVSDEEWQKFINGINNEKTIIIKETVDGQEVEKEVATNNRLVITAYEKDRTEYQVYFDANSNNEINESVDTLIETIIITTNNDAVQGKGLIGDIISPETGDMIAYGGLAIAAIAGAGLYISNKKRK